MRAFVGGVIPLALLSLAGCAAKTIPPSVGQAAAVAESPAAEEAKEFAPQAYLAAQKLEAEAQYLQKEGRSAEAEAAAEQAIAAYNYAFALTRIARAEERIERAQEEKRAKLAEQARLDQLMAQLAADADAYEMRARVHLDQEPVGDVETMTPERAKMRRLAAKQMTAEARLLCLSTELLESQVSGLAEAKRELSDLEKDLSTGSVNKDLFPRSTDLRAACLGLLTETRRPEIRKAPESAASDRLLSSLTKAGTLMAYRDDRGVVVNLGKPLGDNGTLSASTEEALSILGGTARAHRDFPILVVVHTAESGQTQLAKNLGDATKKALETAGAPEVVVHSVDNAQPVVSSRITGAAAKNQRVEVIFVSPGR